MSGIKLFKIFTPPYSLIHVALRILLIVWIEEALAKIAEDAQEDTSSNSSVQLMTWGTETVVHRGRTDIYLSDYSPQNSVVVLIVNNVPWTEHNLRNLSGQFTIHAPSGQGLVAVVQVLNLRSDSNCIDYLQLYDPKSAVGTSKICGKLKKEDKNFNPVGMIGPRVFHSPSGKMKVQYKSDKGDPAFPIGDDISFHMVEIVFTAYKDCDSIQDEMALNRCGEKCISSMLFCDERINCGFEEDFALDEISCEAQNDSKSGKGSFLVNLYSGIALFIVITALVALYYHQDAYRRIQNIPHK